MRTVESAYNTTMKKIISLAVVFILMIQGISFADTAGIDGGILGDPLINANTFEYKEVTFMTGEPIVLTGTVTVPTVDETASKYTKTYTYALQNTDKNMTLSRKITYDITKTKSPNVDQTIMDMQITKLDESYTIGGVAYTLGSYLFDKSALYDNTPAVDYYSGNVYSKRVFYKNGDAVTNEGKLTIESNSESLVGYKHKWGDSETEVIHQNLKFEYPNPSYNGTTDKERYKYWTASAILKMASTDKVSFELQKTDPLNISFRGNYIQTNTQENILAYTYNLPTSSSSGFDETKRNKGSNEFRTDVVTDNTSKITPKIKDIGGHWAENDIFLLASVGVYDSIPNYYMPDLPISRIEFAKLLTRAITDELNKYDDEATYNKEIILRQRPSYKALENFDDIDPYTKDALYTEYVRQKGIMNGIGVSGEFFKPYRSLTRAEAIAILVRSLGLENLAPNPPYSTGFADDGDIPLWAKDEIYVSNEVNLVTGYEDGTIRPNNEVTKAEAAALINKFITHLKDEITVDYREKVINRY